MQIKQKIRKYMSVTIVAMLLGLPLYVMYTTVNTSDAGITMEEISTQMSSVPNAVELRMMEDGYLKLSINDYFPAGWNKIYTSSQSTITITMEKGDILYFKPTADWFGHEYVTITAVYPSVTKSLNGTVPPAPSTGEPAMPNSAPPSTGPINPYISKIFSIEVSPVNDRPMVIDNVPKVFQLTANSNFKVSNILSLNDIFRDVDSKLTYSVSGGDSVVTPVMVNNDLFSLQSHSTQGVGSFTIVASDQDYSIPYTFYVQVLPKKSFTMYEDTVEMRNLDEFIVSGLSGYKATGSEHISASMVNVLGEKPQVSLVPVKNWYGSETIAFEACTIISPSPPHPIILNYSTKPDNGLLEAASTYGIAYYKYAECDLSVLNINDPPAIKTTDSYTIGMTSDTLFNLPEPIDLSRIFEDMDSPLSYSWNMANGYAAPIIRNGLLTDITTASQTGEDTLTLFASDGEYVAHYDIPLSVKSRMVIGMKEDSIKKLHPENFVDTTNYYDVKASEHINIAGSSVLEPKPNWNGQETISLVAYPVLYGINPPIGSPIALSAPPGSGINPPQPAALTYDCYEFDVDVASVNDAPTMVYAPQITLNEDQKLDGALNVSDYFQDIDSTLQYTISSSNSMIKPALGADNKLDVTLASNWFGEAPITLSATDGEYTVSQNIDVKVLPVNDPPFATSAPVQLNLDEDANTTVQLNTYMSDVDNALWYSCLSDNKNVSVDVNETTWTATVTPTLNWNGPVNLTVYGSDGQYQLARNISLDVKPVNDPPVILSSKPVVFNEDSTTSMDIGAMFADVDSSLTYMAFSKNGDITARVSGSGLSLAPAGHDWNGNDIVTIVASDGQYSVETAITASVLPVNDAPQFGSNQQAFSTNEDVSLNIAMGEMFSDIDSNRLSYTIQHGDGIDAVLDASGQILSITPATNWNGETTISITASDGELTASGELSVVVNAVDDAPYMTRAVSPVILRSGDVFTLDIRPYFADVEGSNLQFDVTGYDGITVEKTDTNGVFQITVPKDWQGTQMLSLSVSDGTNTMESPIYVSATEPPMVLQASTTGDSGWIQPAFWAGAAVLISVAALGTYSSRRNSSTRKRDNIL